MMAIAQFSFGPFNDFSALQVVEVITSSETDYLSRQQVAQSIQYLLRTLSREYCNVEQDFQSELAFITDCDRWAEDVVVAVESLLAITADVAYRLGRLSVEYDEKKKARRRHNQLKDVQHYLHFTRNPMLVKQHEVEFFDFLDRLEPVLKTACEMLIAGYTMNETSKKLGFKDQRTLKSRLQKAFGQFLDR
jgi:hypothetical protein